MKTEIEWHKTSDNPPEIGRRVLGAWRSRNKGYESYSLRETTRNESGTLAGTYLWGPLWQNYDPEYWSAIEPSLDLLVKEGKVNSECLFLKGPMIKPTNLYDIDIIIDFLLSQGKTKFNVKRLKENLELFKDFLKNKHSDKIEVKLCKSNYLGKIPLEILVNGKVFGIVIIELED